MELKKNMLKEKWGVRWLIVYSELAKTPVFSIENVQRVTRNVKTAYSQLNRLMKKGLIRRIRKDIYSAINPTTGLIVANPYQIACAITNTAYISHHSAFEYYGLSNQVYEVYVSSETKFNHFEFGGIVYKFVQSRMQEGVVEAKKTIGVRITDLERTVIDGIRDLNRIGGLEELLACLQAVPFLDEQKLMQYLKKYNTQSLYQKAGYLFEHYRKNMHLSEHFISYCKDKIGKSRPYLVRETSDSCYDSEWQLMVPERLHKIMTLTT